MKTRLFMVAGEASADLHASALLKELKKLHPEIECFGVGGARLREAGMNILLESERLNVVGISDWFDRAGEVLRGYRTVVNTLKAHPPDFAVLLDLPDFNLRLAKLLKRMRVPVIYYISPQVWAWRKYRIHQIKRDIDLMMVVFPFEKDFYAKEGMKVSFVGHPLLELLNSRANYRSQSEIESNPRIAFLPGSRRSEVKFHGNVLSHVAEKIKRKYPNAEIKVPVAPTLNIDFVKKHVSTENLTLVQGNSHQLLEWSDLALVASGTATLETALIGTPFALFYKVSPTSAWIWKNLMSYRGYIGMPNLLHGREVVREFFQEKASSEDLFEEVERLIQNEPYRAKQISSLQECRKKLGDKGANLRAAKNVAAFFQGETNLEEGARI